MTQPHLPQYVGGLYEVKVQRPCSKRANPANHVDTYLVLASDAGAAQDRVAARLRANPQVLGSVLHVATVRSGRGLPPVAEVLL